MARLLRVLLALLLDKVESTCTRCTTPDAAGTFNADTFIPSSGCYYGIPTVPDTFELLGGHWLSTCGGSNSWVVHNALARQLEPSLFPWLDERYDGTTNVWPQFADLVWELANGSYTLVHTSYICAPGNTACDPGTSANHAPFEALSSARTAAGIPQYTSNHVRVTFGLGRVYADCDEHLNYMVSAGNGWGSAPKIAYIQSGVWYFNGYGIAQPTEYESDLRAFLSNQSSTCSTAGTTCFLAPISCVNLASDTMSAYGLVRGMACDRQARYSGDPNEIVTVNGLTEQIVASEYASTFRFIDVVSLITAKPQEALDHTGTSLALWHWWLMFNSLPTADAIFGDGSSHTACPETINFSDECLIHPAAPDNNLPPYGEPNIERNCKLSRGCDCANCGCDEYVSTVQATSAGARVQQWVCLLFRPCTYTRDSPVYRPPPMPTLPPPTTPPLPSPPPSPPPPSPSPPPPSPPDPPSPPPTPPASPPLPVVREGEHHCQCQANGQCVCLPLGIAFTDPNLRRFRQHLRGPVRG